MVAEREQAAATAVIDPEADTADATPADIPAADEGEYAAREGSATVVPLRQDRGGGACGA